MEPITGGQSNEQSKQEVTSSVSDDGTKWETVSSYTVIKAVLGEYLAIVTEVAEAAINEQASDWAEEAARALAAGFGAAMVKHGRDLNNEGYEHGYEAADFDCKASLGLLGEDGKETAQYHRMQTKTKAKRKAEYEAGRLTGE